MKRVTLLNGPEPTGLVFLKFAMSFTFDQTCCGTTKSRLIVAAMNCESGVLSLTMTL